MRILFFCLGVSRPFASDTSPKRIDRKQEPYNSPIMALAERDWENAVQGLGNAKSMTSVGNSALLPANVDRQPPLQRGLIINFQLQNLQLHNKSLKDWSINCFRRISMFPKAVISSYIARDSRESKLTVSLGASY